MAMDIEIWSPESLGNKRSSAFVPYGSFYVFLRMTGSTPSLPLKVTITETPDPIAGTTAYPVGGGSILKLNKAARINDPSVLGRNYKVDKLSAWDLKWSYVRFQVFVNSDQTALDAFKGSTMRITVSNDGGYSESTDCLIRNSNPNNHYHWRREPQFVDGAYFKSVYIDASAKHATPFFFLYGVNNSTTASSSASFAMFGTGGSVGLDSAMRSIPGSALTALPDPIDDRSPSSAYTGEQIYGLDAQVGADFAASDNKFLGKKTLPSGDEISWDLRLTKLHTGCVTDWNPLAVFHWIPGFREEETPGMPLMKYTISFPFMTAYYMSHNSNSFISGTVKWKGTTYNFNNLKGYQDSNWGSGGFPHPYVWMQANNFFDSSGKSLDGTSLVALYTPGMPLTAPLVKSTLVAGICLRHNGKKYQIIGVDPTVFFAGALDAKIGWLLARIPELGSVQCTVTFDVAGVSKTVDMSNADNVKSTIGEFVEPTPAIPAGRTNEALPIKWVMRGSNVDKDEISITAECHVSSVMSLAAPLNGKMVDKLTKESLLTRFTVKLKPEGGAEITLTSDFGTAEFGD